VFTLIPILTFLMMENFISCIFSPSIWPKHWMFFVHAILPLVFTSRLECSQLNRNWMGECKLGMDQLLLHLVFFQQLWNVNGTKSGWAEN
jgi:hypothetical protein